MLSEEGAACSAGLSSPLASSTGLLSEEGAACSAGLSSPLASSTGLLSEGGAACSAGLSSPLASSTGLLSEGGAACSTVLFSSDLVSLESSILFSILLSFSFFACLSKRSFLFVSSIFCSASLVFLSDLLSLASSWFSVFTLAFFSGSISAFFVRSGLSLSQIYR